MAKVNMEYDEMDLKRLVLEKIQADLNIQIDLKDLVFEVKSKNNYKPQEWEIGRLRIRVEKSI